MLSINSKLIFSFPVYHISEELFEKKWSNYFNKNPYKRKLLNYTYTGKHSLKYANYWKYTHIVGYIEMYKDGVDLLPIIYTKNSKYRFDKTNSYGFKVEHVCEMHQAFSISKDLSKSDLINKIKSAIEHYKKAYFSNKSVVDYSVFDAIVSYLDLKELLFGAQS